MGFIFDISGTLNSIWIKENVSEEYYKKTSSISQIVHRSLRLLAAILSGIILTINLKYSLSWSLILLGITIFLLLPIRISNTEHIAKRDFKASFKEGLNYIRKNKVLLQFLILTIDNLFFNMQSILLLFYIEDFLHEGPIFLSMLGGIADLGIAIGSAYAPRIKNGKLGFYYVVFGTFISLAMMSYVLIHNAFLAIIPTFIIFFFSGINSVLTSSVLMRIIDKEYMGRVRGVLGVVSSGLNFLSGPLGGVLIMSIGVGGAYLLIGLVTLVFFYLVLAFKEYYNQRI